MLAKYFSIIRNNVLSVFSQRKYNFYHQITVLGAFRTNSGNTIGRNPSMVIRLLANQDLTPMLLPPQLCIVHNTHLTLWHQIDGDIIGWGLTSFLERIN